jgi:hypothetical protein
MYRRGRAVRAVGLVLAVLQLTLPATVAWVDGCLDGAVSGLSAVVRVEAPGAPAHRHVHPPDCPFCQFLGHQFELSARVSLPPVVAAHVFPERPGDTLVHWTAATHLPRQRAPPALL